MVRRSRLSIFELILGTGNGIKAVHNRRLPSRAAKILKSSPIKSSSQGISF